MRWLVFVLMGTIAAPALPQARCSSLALAQAVALVHQRQSDLLKVKVEEFTTEVSPTLQGQIHGFKDALTTAVDAAVACAPAGESAEAMQARLAKVLDANLPEKQRIEPRSDSPPVGGEYGRELAVSVSAPVNAPQMRTIEVSFGIECGNDTMMLLYEAGADGWRRILRWQSGAYKEISGAFGDFLVYGLMPGTDASSVRIAVAHGTPWCTSRFSGFKLDVLALEPSGGARVVWHTDRNYSRGDFQNKLNATADGFELRVNAATFDVSSAFERTVIYRYKVAGDKVQRVAPIATNGRGFVEEWLSMPWEEAKAVTAPEAAAAMKIIHDQVGAKNKNSKTYVSYSYGPVRACSVKGRYEVEMDADPGGAQFYAIQEGQGGYLMVNFATTQDERCSGPDVMKKR